MTVARQVVILYAATNKLLVDVPVEQIREFSLGPGRTAMEETQPRRDGSHQSSTGELCPEAEQAIRRVLLKPIRSR